MKYRIRRKDEHFYTEYKKFWCSGWVSIEKEYKLYFDGEYIEIPKSYNSYDEAFLILEQYKSDLDKKNFRLEKLEEKPKNVYFDENLEEI